MHGFVHFYGWICQIRHVKAHNLIGQEALSDCSQGRRTVINLYILLGYVKTEGLVDKAKYEEATDKSSQLETKVHTQHIILYTKVHRYLSRIVDCNGGCFIVSEVFGNKVLGNV